MPVCICPECSRSHKVPEKILGTKARCVHCGTVFRLNDSSGESQQAERSSHGLDELAEIATTARAKPVADLASRPALSFFARVYTFIGWMTLAGSIAVALTVTAFVIADDLRALPVAWTLLLPGCAASILCAIGLIASGELIRLAIGVETRLHEISRNASR